MKKITGLLVILFASLLSTALHANSCDEFSPSFIVAGKNKWQGMSIPEIIQSENNLKSADKDAVKDQTIFLKKLVLPYEVSGLLVVSACNGGSHTFKVADLIVDADDEAGYQLSLSKKQFFKLVTTKNARPILKKVYKLQLVK